MLIFYLTVTRNPAGVNQSIKAGLLTHPVRRAFPASWPVAKESDRTIPRKETGLTAASTVPDSHRIPYYSARFEKTYGYLLRVQIYE